MSLSFNTLHEFVDWFVPAEVAGDRELRKQARLFLISHLLGPFLGNVVPIALYILDPNFINGINYWAVDYFPGGWYGEAAGLSPSPLIDTYAPISSLRSGSSSTTNTSAA